MQLVCLILEPVVLVADDLSAMIEELAPGTWVELVSTEAEALVAFGRLPSVDLAFVDVPPDRFMASDLGKALIAAETVVVFLGYEAEARALGQRYLERPVLGQAIATHLTQVRGQRLASISH